MLHRAAVRVISRTVVPCTSLVKAANKEYIIRKSSTLFKKHAVVVLRSIKIGPNSGRQKLHTEDKETIEQIKNAFCNELYAEDAGAFVLVHGIVKEIEKGQYIMIKDKTGSVRLVIDNKRKDLIDWIEKLQKFSSIKVIGIVKEEKYNDTEKFVIEVSHIISSLPPSNNSKKILLAEDELEPKTEPLEESITEKTLMCTQVTKKRIGESVQVFGWIKQKDKESKSFVLSDANKSILVILHASTEGIFKEIQKLEIKDMVFVEGFIIDDGSKWAHKDFFGTETDKLRLSANFIKKINEEYFLKQKAPDFNRYTVRNYNCGELNANHIGQKVQLMGWVIYVRMDKFILLGDKYGLVQLLFPQMTPEVETKFKNLTLESVISVEGIVSKRPPGSEKMSMSSGEIEVIVMDFTVINSAEKLPFYSKDPIHFRMHQLQYKYLSLRQCPEFQMNLKFRSDIIHKMRKFLIERVGFVEVETPTLFIRSPGGAQEFIVPTRKKGEFYALVQSPQQFKQLLMVGGLDRYFQIARCYRDEDILKDRQPEFTQLDLEISFCNQEGIMQLMEDIIKFIWPENFDPINYPFPRMTYEEAMTTYGTDKPDLRFDWKIKEVTDIFKKVGKSCSTKIDMETYMKFEDFTALSLVAPEGMVSYPFLKHIAEESVTTKNCKIFAFKTGNIHKLNAALNKLFVHPIPEMLQTLISCEAKDVVFLGFGRRDKLLKTFGKLRCSSAKKIEECGIQIYDRRKPFNFLWVYDFPLFEEVNGVIQSVHHPFSQPHPDDMNLLETDLLKVRGLTYDLVLNGNEIGGGSIRIHDPKLQKKVIENILKLDTSHFQHMLDALSYGAPSHGGFALGIDRFIALLRGSSNILDVIAFPKSSSGRDPLTGAPTDISKEDKIMYHIQ